MMRHYVWIILLGMVSQSWGISVSHQVDRARIQIGDRIRYELNMVYPESYKLIAIPRDYEMPEIEVSGASQSKDFVQHQWVFHRQYDLQVFAVDELVLPTQSVQFQVDGRTETVALPAIHVGIDSVLQEGTSSFETPLKDIQVDWRPYILKGLLAVFLLGILGVLGWLMYKRMPRYKRQAPGDVVPQIAPKQWVLVQLATLESTPIANAFAFKPYYLTLTDILKTYLSRQFDYPYVDCTTEELSSLLKPVLSEDLYAAVMQIFREADQVKFAKEIPTSAVHQDRMARVRRFVEGMPE